MPLILQKIVLNGASRHRLNKGFILVRDASHPVDSRVRDTIVSAVNQRLAQQTDLTGFTAEARPSHPSLVGLITPFLPIYTVQQRDAFINSLAKVTFYLLQETARVGCRLTVAGVNPYFTDSDEQPAALCADIHQVEVFDEGEIERIYNLYRQFLPELLAVSTHASIFGGTVQKDFSLRMRVNPSSFLPRYLSQFSTKHLDQLERMMRKDYGLADLRQMDVNPLGGDASLLRQSNLPLLGKTAAALEIRFVDAQCSFPFIRAQIILFQAIAMYGRALARAGKRLPYMRDEVIDENKALAIQGGAGAVLKPDTKFKKDDGGRGFSYHDKGMPERATTALLMTIDGLLMPALRGLECQASELIPIILGAELRQHGKRCLANYAEYQQYLYYTQQRQFVTALQQQIEQLLTSSSLDIVSDYNRRTYPELSNEVEATWAQKLMPRTRFKGQVKWYDKQKGQGFIRSELGEEIFVRRNDIEGDNFLDGGQPVSFEVIKRGERSIAVHVRVEMRPQGYGRITRFDEVRGFGFITESAGADVFVHRSEVFDGVQLHVGDLVIFEVIQTERGSQAVRVHVQKCPHVPGKVKWFDPQKRFGYISQPDGKEIFVHQNDLEGTNTLKPGQSVRFEIIQGDKGPKATHVRTIAEE